MSSTDATQNKKNNPNNNMNPKIQKLIEEPFVKDLLIKIDVLKKGLREEKNKNNELSAKVEELEKQILEEKNKNTELNLKLKRFEMELTSKILKLNEEVVSKTSQIDALIQDKMDLEKALKNQPKRDSILNILKFGINDKGKSQNGDNTHESLNMDPNSVEAISSMANAEIRKLNEEISQLKYENGMCVKKMTDALEKTENMKLEFKNEIKVYNDKIKSLEDQIKMLQEERDELQDRIKLTSSISSQTIKETEHFKGLLYDYKKGKEDAVKELDIFKEKYNKLMEENESHKKEIERLETN